MRGAMSIGAAREGDVWIDGHNIAARHVVLHFGAGVRIEVRKPYAVRIDGRPPRPREPLLRDSVLTIGDWRLALEPEPPSGIEPIDEALLASISDDDARLVYADSLEERGRLAEAELVRGAAPSVVPVLAARTPPAWRRRFLPMAIEACAVSACPRVWSSNTCTTCGRVVVVTGNIGVARAQALHGNPVAVDPAVRRFPNDLRKPVVREPAIVMGQPTTRR